MKAIFIRASLLLSIFVALLLLVPSFAQGKGLSILKLTDLKAESRNGNVGISWKTLSEQDLRQFEIEYSRDGKFYQNLGFIPARNHITGDIYEFEQPVMYSDSAFYRIKIVDKNGQSIYTDAFLYQVNKLSAFFVYPSVINTSVINMYLQDGFNSLQVVSLNGTVMLKQNLSGKTGRVSVPLSPGLSHGVYVVQLSDNHEKTITQKVIIE